MKSAAIASWCMLGILGFAAATKCTGDAADAPTHGKVSLSDTNKNGSVATFSCDEGYLLDGAASLTCNATSADAPWPDAAPACTGCTTQGAACTLYYGQCATKAGYEHKTACHTAVTGNYVDGGAAVACTEVVGAATGATYTCTTAANSRVSACAATHTKGNATDDGSADTCYTLSPTDSPTTSPTTKNPTTASPTATPTIFVSCAKHVPSGPAFHPACPNFAVGQKCFQYCAAGYHADKNLATDETERRSDYRQYKCSADGVFSGTKIVCLAGTSRSAARALGTALLALALAALALVV